MKSAQFTASMLTAIILAVLVLVALNGMGGFSSSPAEIAAPKDMGTPRATVMALSPTVTIGTDASVQVASPTTVETANGAEAGTVLPEAIPSQTPTPTAVATLVPVGIGQPGAPEPESMLLLYDPLGSTAFDFNFCRVAEYYGVGCRKLAVGATPLTDAALRMADGSYFKLVGLSPGLLAGQQNPLGEDALDILQSAVAGGMNLLVPVEDPGPGSAQLARLTDGAILGTTKPPRLVRKWLVSDAEPDITRSFTGQEIGCRDSSAAPAEDLSFSTKAAAVVTPLLSVMDDAEAPHGVFLRVRLGSGSVFVDGGEKTLNLKSVPLSAYNDSCQFSEIVPLMWIARWALGDKAWHSDRQFANLTIDDPALTEPFKNLNFAGLLRESKLHNFHTTIAFIPANLHESETAVVQLFLDNPDRLSLVQHGNNGDGYEFYKYDVSVTDIYTSTYTGTGQRYPARPLVDQEADILEGLARLQEHQRLTGIPYDKIMVFPYGLSPEPTLALLKKYNYLATINGTDVPLDAERSSRWDFRMYQANMDYGNFPTLLRREPGAYDPFRADLQPFIFDLFLGKPALFFSHQAHLFASGMDTFNGVADEVNRLPGGVEWRSLGDIMKHLYLERTKSDGSIDIKMYGNDLIVTPKQPNTVYHVAKEEILNVPIESLTVNGQEFPYRIEDGALKLDVVGPADASPFEIVIRYGEEGNSADGIPSSQGQS